MAELILKGLFDTCSDVVHVHVIGCAMLRRGRGEGQGRRGARYVLVDGDGIQDLRERGYRVVECKCVKKTGM